ncbi:hypothetical protein IVB14_03915 [Bradyrhizobium sp. 180]|nr:hypothetical protein [Bradyrhizobium sp. 180]
MRAFTRTRPLPKPWPDDIERERVVIEAPKSCACCGGARIAKLSEDRTETLEETPPPVYADRDGAGKFTCRDCAKISQRPAPFHARPPRFIGQLLSTKSSFVKNWSPAPGSSGISSRDGLEEGSDDDTQELCVKWTPRAGPLTPPSLVGSLAAPIF